MDVYGRNCTKTRIQLADQVGLRTCWVGNRIINERAHDQEVACSAHIRVFLPTIMKLL